VVVFVDRCLATVEVGWGDPFDAAVRAFARDPAALFDHAVVGAAGQGEFVDVGWTVVGVAAVDVVRLTPVPGGGAARPGTSAIPGKTV
jgi:hypothetical protein